MTIIWAVETRYVTQVHIHIYQQPQIAERGEKLQVLGKVSVSPHEQSGEHKRADPMALAMTLLMHSKGVLRKYPNLGVYIIHSWI